MPIDIDQLGLDLGPTIGLLMRRYYPLLLKEAFAGASQELAVDVVFSLESPFTQEVLDGLAKLVRGVADTTKDEIRALVEQSTAEGWNLTTLAQQIREHGVTASRSRSEAIARTETARAYSAGSLLAYEESGVVAAVEWNATLDDATSPECEALHGTRAPIGEAFADGSKHPPRHPNCRCALIPIVEAA